MIDVVFLLLVFFMLASTFTKEKALPLLIGGGAENAWDGPLRLIDVDAGGTMALNGEAVTTVDLAARINPLMQSPDDPIALRGREATTQDIVTVMDHLRAAGFRRLILVE